MAVKLFKMEEGSEQHHFFECTEEVAFYTGGYGNGKTAVLAILAILCASEYKNGRFLVGRASRPKLEDSTKPELLKWLPEESVISWPSERKNNLVLATGSTIEFRHIRQEGKGKGEEQGNLLSATYDGIFVDQIDDPEFNYKDFEDLIGRLRGTAEYIGDKPYMPKIGPQWFRATANPTHNWLFRELVNPYFIFNKTGMITPKLLYDKETKKPIIKVFNAPSKANERNTGGRYTKRMGIVFRGSMKKRFIEGDWSAYDGLVYPDYDDITHVVQHEVMHEFIMQGIVEGKLGIIEGYDYGQVVPSCYLLAFYDAIGNIFITDGYYEPLKKISEQAVMMKKLRNEWNIIPTDMIYADPDIFRAKHATADKVGETIAAMFEREGIQMQRGSNAVEAGIVKVSSYLQVDKMHRHPITGNYGAPRMFISSKVPFLSNEFVDYCWNKNILGQNVDKPRDVNDHGMDTVKYLVTKRPNVVGMIRRKPSGRLPPALMAWHEAREQGEEKLLPRHAA